MTAFAKKDLPESGNASARVSQFCDGPWQVLESVYENRRPLLIDYTTGIGIAPGGDWCITCGTR
jgi:hypothetical protein